MLAWIGIALLSASWLFGVEYYRPPVPLVWLLLVIVGTLLLTSVRLRLPSRPQAAVALLLTAIAAAFWVLWQPTQRDALVLLLVGLVLHAAPLLRDWIDRRNPGHGPPRKPGGLQDEILQRLAGAPILAGCILLLQSLGLELYEAFTARSHELPAPLPRLLGVVAGLLGIDAGVDGSTVAIFSMREIHALGATWELLLDPVTFSFLLAGLAAIAWRLWSDGFARGTRLRALGKCGALIGVVLLWLPVRAGLLMALFLHGVLRTDYDEMLNSMYWFWSAGLHLLLLGVPVVAAWRFCGLTTPSPGRKPGDASGHQLPVSPGLRPGLGQTPSDRVVPLWRRALAGGLVCAAAAALTAAVLWDPVGTRKEGRVIFEEFNPDPDKVWERTDKPFDTKWYGHDSGYTYYCIYDYLGHHYDASRLTRQIDDDALRDCDVLVLKTPTRPFYSTGEIASIRRFVERGGGLLLIGEHTDVYGVNERLNVVARQFGFRFVPDCLFGMGYRKTSVFEQVIDPPPAAHPVLQYVRGIDAKYTAKLDFATSCSLAVGSSSGRAVIRSTGLKNKMAEYHVNNFYPPPSDAAKMRYGAFVQLWSTTCGQGRVLAFTDSTQFSNFCTFDRGKSELMLGMIEWLNHRPRAWNPRPWLTVLALLLAAGAIWAAAPWRRADRQSAASRGADCQSAHAGWQPAPHGFWLVLLAAGLVGHAAAAGAVAVAHTTAMPLPQPKEDRPLVRVAMDRSVSSARLPINGFMDGRINGFGIFERWALRLGYFTSRRDAPQTFASDVDLLVIAYPRQEVSQRYREQLEAYVSGGGRLLVIDSAKNSAKVMEDEKKEKAKSARLIAKSLRRGAADEGDEPEEPEEPDHCDEAPPEVLAEKSTANDLLEPFQMSIECEPELQGPLKTAHGLPPVPVNAAVEVRGGKPFAWVDGRPVAAQQMHGQGVVVVVGFGDRLCDQQMGITGDIEPDAEMKKVYDVAYSLLRGIVEGEWERP
jgi:hypothetical protein